MTFGTVSAKFPMDMMKTSSSAFRRLDGYRVVWRQNNRDNVKLPDHVIIAQWRPQDDVIAYPSIKL